MNDAGLPRPTPRAVGYLIIAVLLTVTAACSGSSSPKGSSGEPTSSSFKITKADVQSAMSPPPALPDAVRSGVLTTLNRYLNEGMLVPLRSGTSGDLRSAFTGSAAARLSGPDRATLVDEGLPRSSDVKPKTADASVSALAGADGNLSIVTANVKMFAVYGSGANAVTIDRTGDVILVEDGGTWKIDGYDLRVARDSGGVATSTTAHK